MLIIEPAPGPARLEIVVPAEGSLGLDPEQVAARTTRTT
jgi:hypothetical protein